MSDYTPAEIRARIESCKQDLARVEGEEGTLRAEIEKNMGQLREVLGCKPGKEKAAIQELKDEIEEAESQLIELIEEAESIRDGEEGGEE